MPLDRAGYIVTVFATDVSPSMGEAGFDPGNDKGKGKSTSRLELAKEYVARRCEPKVSCRLIKYCYVLADRCRSQVEERQKLSVF